jgi:hypothetical protein
METANHDLYKRRWWLPSVGLAVWLAFFLALNLSAWRLVLISADGDPCMHWRIGSWMIEHQTILRADPFSHTRPGAAVITMEWLTQLLFAAAANLLGWSGIVLLAAALIATTLWLLHRQLLSEGNELLLATGLVLVAAMACSMHWLARPHLVSHLLLVIWAWQLRGFEKDRVSIQQLFIRFVPLVIVWVNLHAGFLAGLILIAIYFVGLAFRAETRKKMLPLGLLGTTCFFASMLNPNGWRLHKYIVDFLGHPNLVHLVDEFRSPNFHSSGATGFLLVMLVLVMMLLVARPRLRPTEILLIGVWGYFALYSARNVPIFAIVITPILATHLNQFLSQCRDSRPMRYYRKVSGDISTLDRSASGRIPAVLIVGLLIAAIAWPVASHSRPLIATEILTNRFPVATVEYLKGPEAKAALHGEMFNDYGWGGYLMLYLPERKVFIDGRNDFYGEELVREFRQVYDVKPGWENVLEKYNVGWTILPRKHSFNSLLALRKDWKLLYQDDVATVYTRSR